MAEVDGQWDIVVTSLQDICNANESISFDNKYGEKLDEVGSMSKAELLQLKSEINEHKDNIALARRLVETATQHLGNVIADSKPSQNDKKSTSGYSANVGHVSSKKSSSSKKNLKQKFGRLYYTSPFNPLEPIIVGLEVAYKLKNRYFEEWIQCEVMRVIGDGIKFEIRDPEPDENNNPGQTFKANYKEILLIPPLEDLDDLTNYTYGTKVLARYPETTTFYPAIVVGNRKDGRVRLKFDGEEEVNKETEVERRLVLPFPER